MQCVQKVSAHGLAGWQHIENSPHSYIAVVSGQKSSKQGARSLEKGLRRAVSDEKLFLVQALRNGYLGHCNIPNPIFSGGHSSSQSVGVNVGKSLVLGPLEAPSAPENGSNFSQKAFGEKNSRVRFVVLRHTVLAVLLPGSESA